MELKRALGSVDAAWLVAGNMIGAGIFFMPGIVAAHLPGLIAPLAAWACGGGLALLGAAIYGELGARLPRAGGDYQYLARGFSPLWGFLTGWAGLLLTFSAAAAVMCIVAVDYLESAGALLFGAPRLSLSIVAAPVAVLLLTLANTAGAVAGGRTTVLLTAVPLAGLIGLFGVGLGLGNVDLRWPEPVASVERNGLIAFSSAMLPIYFTYSGWNAAAYLAGEIRDPGRNLARGLLMGTALVTLLYMLVNLVLLLVVPPQQLAGSTTAGADAARLLLGPRAEGTLSLLIAIAVLGSANVTLMAGARIYYAMARDALAPPFLGRVNAAGVPAAALWVSGIWTALLATAGRLELLLNWATLAMLLLSSMAAASLFVLRRRDEGDPAYRCPGYPYTPLIYLVASLGVAGASAVAKPMESLYGLLIVASGVPVYLLMRRIYSEGAPSETPSESAVAVGPRSRVGD
jgi:APA family basic amino acid/polyamine antiporter